MKDAGFPDLLFHDLRRSAVRNMVEEIGMSEKRAMEISGHKTRSCFDRYHIVPLADIQESGQKMDKWMKEQRAKVNASATRKRKRKSLSGASYLRDTGRGKRDGCFGANDMKLLGSEQNILGVPVRRGPPRSLAVSTRSPET